MWNKLFVGYDLGDGETICESLPLKETDLNSGGSLISLVNDMTMPDRTSAGQAIPTVYGYQDGKVVFASTIESDPVQVQHIHASFKRCPSDLLPSLSNERPLELRALLEQKGWPDAGSCPELNTPAMKEFASSIVAFTNGIFEHPQMQASISSYAKEKDEIVFFVGHPTRWSPLDVAIYQKILEQSVIGQQVYANRPASLAMGAESRAAFLYNKDLASVTTLPQGSCVLLIDIGSSTIDVTALTADSRNCQYHSGNNHLGARSIDYMIRDWYLGELRKDPEDWAVYQAMVDMNPSISQALTLACRDAKEKAYSVASGTGTIYFLEFHPKKIHRDMLDQFARTVPLAPLLKQYIGLGGEKTADMGVASWCAQFTDFLTQCKVDMEKLGILVQRVILTGSASRMTFVPQLVKQVFPAESILTDTDPAKSIAKGLALIGPFNEKSMAFQQDLEKMIETAVPATVDKDIAQLADSVSKIVAPKIIEIVKSRMLEWRSGKIKTLKAMTEKIQDDCTEASLTVLLKNNAEYNQAIRHWSVDIVGQDIAMELRSLCTKYGVYDFSLENLNVMKAPSVKIGKVKINPSEDVINIVGGIISMIAGIVTGILTPVILGVVIGLLSYLSVNLAAALMMLLLATPVAGLVILAAIAGVSVAVLTANGVNAFKEAITENIQTYDLPKMARNLLNDQKIEKSIQDMNIQAKIKNSMLEEQTRQKICKSVMEGLKDQIRARAEDIKYVIESR